MKKETVDMIHKVYKVLEEKNDTELLAELKQFVRNVRRTECLLTRGGIIQDREGNFLTAGDRVIFLKTGNETVTGTLEWKDNKFIIKCDDGCFTYNAISCNMVKAK